MKCAVLALFLALGMCVVPAAAAQEHGQVGVYADYFRLSETKTNLVGLGGRFSVNLVPAVQMEAQMSYDFARSFTEGFTNTTTGSVNLQPTDIRVLHGLFGPKFQTTHGIFRAFITVKGGFINFRLDPRPASFATFTSSINNLRANNVDAEFYPGGGLEADIGPLGLRLDIGDEMYFAGDTHHNLRVTFGPILRF